MQQHSNNVVNNKIEGKESYLQPALKDPQIPLIFELFYDNEAVPTAERGSSP